MLSNPVHITLLDRGIDVQQLYDNFCLHNSLVGPLISVKPVVYTPVHTLTKGNELHRSGRDDCHFLLSPGSVFDHCALIYLPLTWCMRACLLVSMYLYLLHTECQSPDSTSKLKTFWEVKTFWLVVITPKDCLRVKI